MAEAQRIGLILHDLPLGGTERIALRLAGAWARAGREVTLFCGSARGPTRSLLDPAVGLVEADPPIPRGLFSRRRLARAAARHFAAQPVDALFIPGNFHWPVVPAIAALPAGVRPRLVAQISSALTKAQRHGWRQRRFERRMRRLLAGADEIVALSAEPAAVARDILARPVTAIPLPALPDDNPPLRPIPPGAPLVLGAGRFVAQKDFANLVDAFARLGPTEARLAIVGDGPLRPAVQQQVARLGLVDQIELPGLVEDVRPWLDRARLFVLSSRHEGYGAVIIEALNAGRPVVATNCTPATNELLVNPEAGAIVPIENSEALAGAMAAMLDRPAPDPAKLRASVAGFALAPIATAYLNLFDRP